ncbi:hypothetical protein M9Y10_002698 [Tritrichomonas musculus]|uniref:Uncharacterized protein n=1 Tax=Tritrichomonas musculus TaxID=1915356 RepID=A0ABR2LAI5_9EUKA
MSSNFIGNEMNHPRGRYDGSYKGGIFDENDEEKLLEVIQGLIDANELKLLKKLVRYNETVSQMNTRSMNKRFKIDNHVFRKRYGRLILIPYKNTYQYHPKVNSVKNQAETKLNQFANELLQM